jgi:glycosyltransferase involved in cell wall biosynthesis
MHRHLVERNPFELHVASNADFADGLLIHTPLRLPRALYRLRKSRLGKRVAPWVTDYENFVWPLAINQDLETAIESFKPDVILTLAETGLCHIACKTARRHNLPLAVFFLDWFPIMSPHYGHKRNQKILSERYRKLYQQCDLAFCTSDGMREALGEHPNSHVIYPMPGKHRIPETVCPPKSAKFRLVYVGSALGFYGRMLCALVQEIEKTSDLEIIIVGPFDDWPADLFSKAMEKGICLGFKPPEEAAAVLAGADALLVVMSFEAEQRQFMETSFTTKFLDYTAFGKPIILWGPDYCSPMRVARRDGGALIVNEMNPGNVITACQQISSDEVLRERLVREAQGLHQNVFNPERLQEIFVNQMELLARSPRAGQNLHKG